MGSALDPLPSFTGRALTLVAGILALLASPLAAQTADLPTVDQPVVIDVSSANEQVAPGDRSALIVTFRVPKYMWLGAHPSQDRTPSGTKIRIEPHPDFRFKDPIYPEPSVEGVPVHAGVTRVYQGEVRIVVPFEVDADAAPEAHDLTVRLTYTPGFNAGSLSTHADEPYNVTVNVSASARTASSVPQPGVADVPDDFVVQRRRFTYPSFAGPMFNEYEESAFTDALHTLFQDPEGHGKTIRHVTYPFLSSTPAYGRSVGGGLAFLNATREGVMTGALSLLAYDNEFTGTTFGFDYITCPAAYKNLRINGRISTNEFRQIRARFEDFTLGEADRWGIQSDIFASTDPRTRFYGLGPGSDESDVSVYDHSEIGAVVDLYHLPVENLRIGVGYKYRSVAVNEGISISDNGFDQIPFTVDRYSNVVGVEGSTTVGGRFNLIYDQRNQEFTPSKGFFGHFTAELDRIIDDHSPALETNYGRFEVDLRQYFSTVDKKMTVVFRSQATFTTSDDLPFYEQATLGGPGTLRAYELGRFRGQHALFGSAEVRYSLAHMNMMSFPMEVVVGGFLDAGQTFGGGTFGDDFNLDPGGTVRFVNPPNVGYILSAAHGEDGVNVTGGISLPF